MSALTTVFKSLDPQSQISLGTRVIKNKYINLPILEVPSHAAAVRKAVAKAVTKAVVKERKGVVRKAPSKVAKEVANEAVAEVKKRGRPRMTAERAAIVKETRRRDARALYARKKAARLAGLA